MNSTLQKMIAGIFLTLVMATPSEAQEARTQVIQPVVVTGTRTEKALADAPVKTELVTEEDIQERHYTDLATAVKDLPGVTLMENPRRPGTAALIQGLGEEHVLVMVDGVPLPQSSSAGFDLSQISTKGIERIEVVKGASSSLYGSQAMGGVINIITREPSDKAQVSLDIKGGVMAEGSLKGETNSGPKSLAAEATGKLGPVGYRLEGSIREQEGYDLDPSSVAQDVDTSEKTNLRVRLERRWENQGRVFTQFRQFNEKVLSVSSALVPMVGPQARHNVSELSTYGVVLGGEKSLGGENGLKAFVSYDETRDVMHLSDNPLTAYIEDFKTSDMKTVRSELQWDQLVAGNHFLSSGLAYMYSGLNQENITTLSPTFAVVTRDVDEKNYWSIAGFVQDDIIFDHWELVPGVRAEYDEDYGSKISPKVSVSYSPNSSGTLKTKVRASIGTGYRVPNLKERFYFLDHTSVASYIVLGDENLKPEESISYQLGVEFSYSDRATFYLNGFRSEVSSLIQTILAETSPTLTTYRYANVGKVDIQGVEARYMMQPLHWLKMDTSYTYSEAVDRATGHVLPMRPYSTARASLGVSLTKSLNFISILNYSGDEFVDLNNFQGKSKGFTLLDSKMNLRLSPKHSLYWGVDNIMDQKRDSVSDFDGPVDLRPQLGRFYYLGYSFSS